MKYFIPITLLAAAAAASPLQASSLQVRQGPPPEAKGKTRIIATNKKMNFGNGYPWDMVRGLGGPDGVCKVTGACVGNPPTFKSTFMNDIQTGTEERFIHVEIEQSEYANEQERDMLIEAAAVTMQEMNEGIDREYGPTSEGQVGDDDFSEGPSGTVLQNTNTEGVVVQLFNEAEGTVSSQIALRFWVEDPTPGNEAFCDDIAAIMGGISAAVSGVVGPLAIAAGAFGIISACCEDNCLPGK